MKKEFLQITGALLLGALIVWIIILLFSLLINNKVNNRNNINNLNFGAFTPGQAQRFSIAGAGAGLADSSITLSSFKTPAGQNITMTMLGDIAYGTLEPGTSKEEQISFTGVTQNANGTATLTGITRGIPFFSPFIASTTLQKTHSGNSVFILSNTAAFYSNFVRINDNATITASILAPSPTVDGQIAIKSYVDSVATSGAPLASITTAGLVILPTKAQFAAGLASSTVLTFYVPQNSFFNASSSATTTGVVTNALGKIDSSFVDFTASNTWSGLTNFSGTASFTGTSTFTNFPTIPTSTPSNANPLSFFYASSSFTHISRQEYASSSANSTTTGITITIPTGFSANVYHFCSVFNTATGDGNAQNWFLQKTTNSVTTSTPNFQMLPVTSLKDSFSAGFLWINATGTNVFQLRHATTGVLGYLGYCQAFTL